LWWSTPVALIAQNGITQRLSRDPHPRDKRACLPKIPSLHNLELFKELNQSNIKEKCRLVRRFQRIFLKLSKIFKYLQIHIIFSKTTANMGAKLNLDKLDLQIIHEMMANAEISYADLGKKLFVSGGTIHVRIKKLEEAGIVKGTRLSVDLKQLGYDVIAFIGIYLEKSSLYDSVARELHKIPEIIRLNYTTGNYSMFAEIICKDINQLRFVLHDELQKIKGIERTETFISLEESFTRNAQVFTP
jgi:Lrp/AsnC family transcriptional regulator for asnA, asnC and gidA